jgi:hypothetical protein
MPMALRSSKTIGVLAIIALTGATMLGIGCGSNGDDGSERAVAWRVDHPVGPNWVRLSASIEVCSIDLPLLEEPIIEYKGKRVYIELRQPPEELAEDVNGCLLQLVGAFKKITFERDLDELVLFDSSTDPPEKRWPTERPLPPERRWPVE